MSGIIQVLHATIRFDTNTGTPEYRIGDETLWAILPCSKDGLLTTCLYKLSETLTIFMITLEWF